MVAKKMQVERNMPEFSDAGSKIGRIFAAVLLYGITLLLGYVVLATPEYGTAMGAIRSVLCGLGGSIAIVIPVIFAWIATLVALSAAGKRISVWRSIVDGVLFVCLFTLIHLFVTENTIRHEMHIHAFANFVSKSYSLARGGGAIGALLAWPLYNYLGTLGGVIGVFILAALSLTATGKLMAIINWSRETADTVQHDTAQRRMEHENERMFDVEPAKVSARRHRPVYPDNRQEELHPAEKLPRRRRFTKNPVEPTSDFTDEPFTVEKPASGETVNVRKAASDEPTMNPFNPLPDEETGKRPRKKRPAKKSPIDEDGVIHVEPNPVLPEAETILDDFDDPIPPKPKKKKKSEEPAFDPETVKNEQAEKGQIHMDDDLTIEPEQCDVLESDAPPFDMPTPRPKQKLKRTPVPAEPEEEPYNYPPIDILEQGDGVQENHRENDLRKAQLLESTLKEFGISTKLTGIAHGPAVTRFELQPAPGVKVSRITGLSDDIAMHLEAMSVRIEAPIPGKAAVGVEIPNDKIEMVRLRDVLESPEARKLTSKLAVCLGKDNAGRYIVADIAKMPHVLIAGQTGSGKSVCINSIITSILYRATPDEVRLILIDPKMVELSIYNDIPHLVCPVVTDCKKAASALDWAVAEMSMRYKRFSERGVRNIKGYNANLKEGEKPMPQMVIIIDELADLMMVAPGEVEDSICRLAQLARAAGMHLVIATQRPSVNVITGIIKANIPSRIAFSVSSQVDSRTIIDHGGAEKLLGNGDMLFVPSGINKPMRVQGAWVSDEEVNAITDYIKARSETSYDADMIEKMDNAARTDAEKEEFNSEYDPRLPEAVEIVVEAGQASVSMLQRRMRVGYARAGRLIDEMEQRGIVSEADGAKPRTVLITREELDDLFAD